MEGTDIRAEVGFRMDWVDICHSMASSGLEKPSGRALRRECMCGRASTAEPVPETRSIVDRR